MSYKYKGFIPEQIAPKNAKEIGVYDNNGNEIYTIPLGRLTPPTKEKLYSFGLLSDIHIQPYNASMGSIISTKFENALRYFEQQSVAFVCVTGDFVNRGFVNSSGTFVTDEFEEYKRICDLFPNLPVYELCGNHENYNEVITNRLTELETYTGKGELFYTITQGNDLFIFIGQPSGSVVMSDDDFTRLGEILEANKDKRCFVHIHSHIDDNVEGGIEDSGNPAFARENSIFGYWGTTKTTNFINLMKKYPNAIVIHGHTHIMFEAQEFDKNANFSDENGFKSVHNPSAGVPRRLVSADGTWELADSESQGYIVDVYDDCVVFNGMDLINNIPVPLGTYKITI